jgi:hypothetical protein
MFYLVRPKKNSIWQHYKRRPQHRYAFLLPLIVGFIPVDHIIELRTVSRLIKNHNENSVRYSCIKHRILFECLVLFTDPLFEGVNTQDSHGLSLVKFNFSHLETNGETYVYQPMWEAPHVVFQLDSQWLETHVRVCAGTKLVYPAGSCCPVSRCWYYIAVRIVRWWSSL